MSSAKSEEDLKRKKQYEEEARVQLKVCNLIRNPVTERVDFKLLLDHPTVVTKNLIFTGLIYMIANYFYYSKFIELQIEKAEPLDDLNKIRIITVYKTDKFLSAFSAIASFLFKAEISVLNIDSSQWSKNIVDKENAIESHVREMAELVGESAENKSFKHFMCVPNYPQEWGCSVWMLRMFTVCLSSAMFQHIREISYFLAHMIYILPCSNCSRNILIDQLKPGIVQTVASQVTDFRYTSVAIENEIWLHHVVGKDIPGHRSVNLDGFTNMYLDIFKRF